MRLSLLIVLRLGLTPLSLAWGSPAERSANEPERAPGTIIEARTGATVSFSTMMQSLRQADVVYVGEVHDAPIHHEAQGIILDALARDGWPLAAGFEVLDRRDQPAVDAYREGRLSDQEFTRRTSWPPGAPFPLYRPLLRRLIELDAAIVALNLPFELVQKIGRDGVQGLTDAERAQLPDEIVCRYSEDYRRWFSTAMEQHTTGVEPKASDKKEQEDRFYFAQCIWNEAMADQVVKFLHRVKDRRRMLVFAGVGHVIFGEGIPSGVARRSPGLRQTVVVPILLQPRKPEAGPATPSPEMLKFGDYLWIFER